MESIVDVEHDPVPLVLIMANVLRRNESDPKRARLLAHTAGRVVFRSASDPQVVTIEFRRGRVMVTRGAAPDADMTIVADLATMSEEKPPKPAVSGALSHLRLALAVSKLLDPPVGDWQQEAERFWAYASPRPGCPSGLKVTCLDDGRVAEFGVRPAEYEIHGTAHRLRSVFSGGSVLGEDLLAGKLYAVGMLRHTAELTGCSLDWMMGR